MNALVRDERPDDVWAREGLLDATMGPIRFRRSSQRLREGRLPAEGLALVAQHEGRLVGTLRLWDVKARGLEKALMLGPLAVSAEHRSLGIGARLMAQAIERASERGHSAIALVGDAPYYERFGFSARAARRLAMPGPFERHRMLGLALKPGALEGAHGLLVPTGRPVEPMAATGILDQVDFAEAMRLAMASASTSR